MEGGRLTRGAVGERGGGGSKAIARAPLWMPRVLLDWGSRSARRLELIETRVSRDTRSDLGVLLCSAREARTVGPRAHSDQCRAPPHPRPGHPVRSAHGARASSLVTNTIRYVAGARSAVVRVAPCVYYLNDINTVLIGTTRSHRHTGHGRAPSRCTSVKVAWRRSIHGGRGAGVGTASGGFWKGEHS